MVEESVSKNNVYDLILVQGFDLKFVDLIMNNVDSFHIAAEFVEMRAIDSIKEFKRIEFSQTFKSKLDSS